MITCRKEGAPELCTTQLNLILSIHEHSLKYGALLLKDGMSLCDVETSPGGIKMMLEGVKTETQGGGASVMYALEPTGHCSQLILRMRPLRHQRPMPAEPV
jgi:hypothetical protein